VTEPVRLETERLILDGHSADDFDAIAAMWADAGVVAHISGRPSSLDESWGRLLRYRGLWPVLGFGYWAVREKASGLLVGDLGFGDFRRDIEPPITGIPEAGWVFAPWAQGRGYAGEALKAALAWLDAEPRFDRSVCLIAPRNERSIRLAERNGYGAKTTIRYRGEDTLLFTRRRPPSG
jgi:RimJ/RimL family protein N-acetyltransferase